MARKGSLTVVAKFGWPILFVVFLAGSVVIPAAPPSAPKPKPLPTPPDNITEPEKVPAVTDIPQDLPADVRDAIKDTFSSSAVERIKAAKKLGAMGNRAGAAVPFLIRLLGDESRVNWYDIDPKGTVGIGEPTVTYFAGNAIEGERGHH